MAGESRAIHRRYSNIVQEENMTMDYGYGRIVWTGNSRSYKCKGDDTVNAK